MNEDLTGRRVHQKDGEQQLGPLIGVVRGAQWTSDPFNEPTRWFVALLIETPTGDLIIVDFDQVRVAK